MIIPEVQTILPDEELKVDSVETAESAVESYIPRKLFEAFPGLEKGETIDMSGYATVALDIVEYSKIQNLSPELAQEMTELVCAYRAKLLTLINESEIYKDLYFLKSAGDELFFAKKYNHILDYLQIVMLITDAHIVFNELLEDERYSKIKNYYFPKKNATDLVQPGICIPSRAQTDFLGIKVSDVGPHSTLTVVGTGAVSKKYARNFNKEAIIGLAESNGITRISSITGMYEQTTSELLKSLRGQFEILTNSKSKIWDLKKAREELYKYYTGLGKITSITAQSELHLTTQHTSDKFAPAKAETAQNGEIIDEGGGVVFVNYAGIGRISSVLNEKLHTPEVPDKLRSKILLEFEAKASELLANVAYNSLSELGWDYYDSEYMVKVPEQSGELHDSLEEQEQPLILSEKTGNHIVILTKGVFSDPNDLSPEDINAVLALNDEITGVGFKLQLAELIASILAEHNLDTMGKELTKVDLSSTIGISEFNKENGVTACVRERRNGNIFEGNRIIGGSGISYAARMAFITGASEGTSVWVAPNTAQRLQIDNTANHKEFVLKGFENQGELVKITRDSLSKREETPQLLQE